MSQSGGLAGLQPDPQSGPRATRAESAESTEGTVIAFDLRTLTHFSSERPTIQVLSDIGTARLVLFAFKAGQQLREHCTSSQLFVQVLRGRVTLTTPGNSIRLQAGMVLQVEAYVTHTVAALTDAVMLATLTPSPAFHSLEHEPLHQLPPLVSRTQAEE
jgi:quercetin dioxygenase-like cupin family protein